MKRYKPLFEEEESPEVRLALLEDESGVLNSPDGIYIYEAVIKVEKELDLYIAKLLTIRDDLLAVTEKFFFIQKLMLTFDKHKIRFMDYDKEGTIIGGDIDLKKDNYIKLVIGNDVMSLDGESFPTFCKAFAETLGHELVHRIQLMKAKEDTIIAKNPLTLELQRKYYASKQEIMAYAWQTIEKMSMNGIAPKDILKILKTDSLVKMQLGGTTFKLYHELFKITSNELKLLYKYLYEYAEDRI